MFLFGPPSSRSRPVLPGAKQISVSEIAKHQNSISFSRVKTQIQHKVRLTCVKHIAFGSNSVRKDGRKSASFFASHGATREDILSTKKNPLSSKARSGRAALSYIKNRSSYALLTV